MCVSITDHLPHKQLQVEAGSQCTPMLSKVLLASTCVQVLGPLTFSWHNLALALVSYLLTNMVGICLAYHRLLTHRQVKLGAARSVAVALGQH